MENPKYQISKATNSQFYFVLRSRNGEIVLKASETYVAKQGCLAAIESVRKNAPNDSRYTRNDSSHYTFNLKAENGLVLGNSETYTSLAGRESGIDAVKRHAPTAPVEDLT